MSANKPDITSRASIASWSEWQKARRANLQDRHELWLGIVKDWTPVVLPLGLLIVSFLAMVDKLSWPEEMRPSYVFFSVLSALVGTRLGPLTPPWRNGRRD